MQKINNTAFDINLHDERHMRGEKINSCGCSCRP